MAPVLHAQTAFFRTFTKVLVEAEHALKIFVAVHRNDVYGALPVVRAQQFCRVWRTARHESSIWRPAVTRAAFAMQIRELNDSRTSALKRFGVARRGGQRCSNELYQSIGATGNSGNDSDKAGTLVHAV